MIFSQMEAELSGMHSHAGAWERGHNMGCYTRHTGSGKTNGVLLTCPFSFPCPVLIQ